MSKHDQVPENSRSGNLTHQLNMDVNPSTSTRLSTNQNKPHSAAIKGFNFTRRPWPHPVPDRHFYHSPSYNNHSPTKAARYMKHLSEQKGSATKTSAVPSGSSKPSPKKIKEEAAVGPQNGPSTKQTPSTTEKMLQQLADFTRNSHKNSIFTPIIFSTSPPKLQTDTSEPSLVVTPRFVPALPKTTKHSDPSIDRTDNQDGSISTIVEVIDQSNKDMQPKSSSTQGNDSTTDQGASSPVHSQLNMEHMVPFVQGSVIQLGSGDLKCVEDISTADLVESAELSDNISTESCTVSKISKKSDENIILDLVVESTKEQIQIESSFEHPFFVMNNGWASCKPDKTKGMYNLECKALLVGDVCLFLVPKDDNDAAKTSTKKPKTTTELVKTVRKTSIFKKGSNNKDAAEDKHPKESTDNKLSKTCGGKKRKRRWSMSDVAEFSVNCAKNGVHS